MAEIIRKKAGGRRRRIIVRSLEKENVYKQLVSILVAEGFEVRREQLKRGPGWKTVSGACRLQDERLIFVDQRLSQDDQIDFLVSRICSLKLKVPEESGSKLPDKILSRLVQTV